MADVAGEVKILRLRFLRGPNVHARRPVMEAELDLGALEGRTTVDFPGMAERLTSFVPGVVAHPCTVGRPGGFLERLESGTDLAHICEHVTLALQALAGFDVRFGRARPFDDRKRLIAVAYESEAPARACLELALRITLAAALDQPLELSAELERLLALSVQHRLDPSTQALAAAARRRRVPVQRLEEPGNLIQLGEGAHQRRARGSLTSRSPALGAELCRERPLCRELLAEVGVPQPGWRLAAGVDQALRAAQELGYPVALKPASGPAGLAVQAHVRGDEELRRAFDEALRLGPQVIIERHVRGLDFRLLVVGGKLVAAARRDPPTVEGDGHSTVRELVAQANREPRRRPGAPEGLARMALDDCAVTALAEQDLEPGSVPERSQPVRLGPCGKLSVGGTATDVTDLIHPDTARTAELVARTLGLDVAGVDVVCEDPAAPLEPQQGAVVAVHAAPGLRMHLQPTSGQPRDVAAPILDLLFPRGARGRIPVIAVVGARASGQAAYLEALFAACGHTVGRLGSGLVRVGGRTAAEEPSAFRGARRLLRHPRVEAAVVEVDERSLREEGLGFERCEAAIVDGAEALPRDALEALAATLLRRGALIHPANDLDLARALDGRELQRVLWAASPGPELAAHREAGGAAIFVEGGQVVLARGERTDPLGPLGDAPAGELLPALAAAWAAGLSLTELRRVLGGRAAAEAQAQGLGST